MDIAADAILPIEEPSLLSYDEVPYEEQLPTEEETQASNSLANRIGSSKVYLLSDSIARAGKVRLTPLVQQWPY